LYKNNNIKINFSIFNINVKKYFMLFIYKYIKNEFK
jgi:hypothetical protein